MRINGADGHRLQHGQTYECKVQVQFSNVQIEGEVYL